MARLPDKELWQVVLGMLPLPSGQFSRENRGHIWRWIWPRFKAAKWPSLRTLPHPYQRTGK